MSGWCNSQAGSSYFPMMDPYTGASFDANGNPVPQSTHCKPSTTLSYDVMGRNSLEQNIYTSTGCPAPQTAFTRTYDALDRTRSELDYSGTTTWATYHYAWAPTGNVRQLKDNGVTYALHWMGATCSS
jgi:hypothetical protein